jgi:hypothetical protein
MIMLGSIRVSHSENGNRLFEDRAAARVVFWPPSLT